jgi:hypothetical protein
MLLALFLAAQAAVAPNPIPTVGFVAAPPEEAYEALYPDRAWDARQGGEVKLHCKLEPTGELTSCTVTEEKPAGFGFGDLSLKLVPEFRVGPGPFPENSHTTIPLSWSVFGSSPSVPSPVPLIRRPVWLKRPTASDYDKYYPNRAARSEVGGRVKMRCTAKADGFMTDCTVLSEEPVGYGFGDASLKVSRFFQIYPKISGESAEGAGIIIPLNWVIK